MEQELLALLEQTLQAADAPRQYAEGQLQSLYANDAFPIALSNIAAARQLPLNSRQAALTTLKRYVSRCWSASFEDYEGVQTSPDVKVRTKPQLLGLVTDEQRKVRSIAAAIVGKIATSDYPEEWPELLPHLLKLIADGNDTQANGALHVLNDVLDEGLGDSHFFQLAREIVDLLFRIATSEGKSFSVRALATMTFKSCLDTLGMMRMNHEEDVNAFTLYAVDLWAPFIVEVLQVPLPDTDSQGLMTLKIQAIRAVMQVKVHFPTIFGQHTEKLFSATWTDMNAVNGRYVREFVSEEADGRLVDADGLPYSLDLYVLELLDFIQTCLTNKIVREQLAQAGFESGVSPFSGMVYACVSLSQISGEDRSMWEIDLNVFLSEETALSANYTPRTASADLILKLAEYFPRQSIQSLLDHTQQIFTSGESASLREAILNLWDQLLGEFASSEREIDGGITTSLLGFVVAAIGSEDDQFLRARGYSVAAALTKASHLSLADKVTELMEQSLRATTSDPSIIVQITAIRSFERYSHSVPKDKMQQYQTSIVSAIRSFLSHKSDDDPEDSQDVLTELVDTLNAVTATNYRAFLDPNIQLPELLFSIAGNGVTNLHLIGLVRDLFEAVTAGLLSEFGNDIYVALCEKLLPMLTPMLSLDSSKNEHPLVDLATEVLQVLVENGISPLPNGFVAAVMPHLTRILLESNDVDLVHPGCGALKEVMRLDSAQLLQWRDPSGKPGLEIILVIIDRLLRPEFSETAATEVGGLAAELVDKAGDQLGSLLPELLQAVARRLQTANQPQFIQSLILVFARLVLKQAKDVVDFLSSLNLGNRNGLEAVISIWLNHTTIFTGYTEIYQNVLALCHLYNLQDPRLSQIMVQDQYTSIPVPLKIIKLLIQELGPSVNERPSNYYNVQQTASDDGSGDEWEDIPDSLSVPGMSREELLALGASGRTSRQADDETYAVLSSFFREVSANNIGNFQGLYEALKQEEQQILSQLR